MKSAVEEVIAVSKVSEMTTAIAEVAMSHAEELDRLRAEREKGVLVPRDVAIHLETMSLEVGGKCHICERFRKLLAAAEEESRG